MLVVALLAEKRQEDQPEHVERSEQRGEQADARRESLATVVALEGAQQDRIFAEESGERRKAGDRQRGRQHRAVRPLDLLAEAAHFAHVLLAAHGVNHAAGREEEKRLEERVRHQVEDARAKTRRRRRPGTCSRAG